MSAADGIYLDWHLLLEGPCHREIFSTIHCFIGEARWKAEKQLFEAHPSLFDIETILRSNAQIGQKILIVADRAF